MLIRSSRTNSNKLRAQGGSSIRIAELRARTVVHENAMAPARTGKCFAIYLATPSHAAIPSFHHSPVRTHQTRIALGTQLAWLADLTFHEVKSLCLELPDQLLPSTAASAAPASNSEGSDCAGDLHPSRGTLRATRAANVVLNSNRVIFLPFVRPDGVQPLFRSVKISHRVPDLVGDNHRLINRANVRPHRHYVRLRLLHVIENISKSHSINTTA